MTTKTIDSDILIGNILIEALSRNIKEIDLKFILDFADEINELLENFEYWINISVNDVYEFVEDYPFFIKFKSDITNSKKTILYPDKFTIKTDEINTMYRLNRYFRIGLPKVVIEEINKLAELMFGNNTILQNDNLEINQ